MNWTNTPQLVLLVPSSKKVGTYVIKDVKDQSNPPSISGMTSGRGQSEGVLHQNVTSNISRNLTPANVSNTGKSKVKIIEKPLHLHAIGKSTEKNINEFSTNSEPEVSKQTALNPESSGEKMEDENDFFCSVCDVDCGNIDRLNEHKSRKDFMCRGCAATFVSHSELEDHFKTHKKYKCNFCQKVFHLRKDVYRHQNVTSSCKDKRPRFKCDICTRTFVNKSYLSSHVKEHYNTNPNDLVCNICETKFKTSSSFVYHLTSIHNAYEAIECQICHKILLGPTKLKQHMNNYHLGETSVRCSICEKVLGSRSIKAHMEIHYIDDTKCGKCGYVAKNKGMLRYHLRIHKKEEENKSYSCSLCKETFKSMQEIVRHKKAKHKPPETPQPVFCDICGKQYKSVTILKHHLVTHSDDKPFVCDICGAAFKTKSVLVTHNRIHTDVSKYSCPKCNQGFKWKQPFDKHVLKCGSSQANNLTSGSSSEDEDA